mmetsp:Transcript_21013/g.57901  ORF Transcript_21013/g.57901 Transcript_21013/m.57901 type:complete len:292 (-) Transcript_21013:742-1617(-)
MLRRGGGRQVVGLRCEELLHQLLESVRSPHFPRHAAGCSPQVSESQRWRAAGAPAPPSHARQFRHEADAVPSESCCAHTDACLLGHFHPRDLRPALPGALRLRLLRRAGLRRTAGRVHHRAPPQLRHELERLLAAHAGGDGVRVRPGPRRLQPGGPHVHHVHRLPLQHDDGPVRGLHRLREQGAGYRLLHRLHRVHQGLPDPDVRVGAGGLLPGVHVALRLRSSRHLHRHLPGGVAGDGPRRGGNHERHPPPPLHRAPAPPRQPSGHRHHGRRAQVPRRAIRALGRRGPGR